MPCIRASGHTLARVCNNIVVEQELEDKEAGRLLDIVRIQTVTRGIAKQAAQEEGPLADKAIDSLLAIIYKLQGSDPLCLRLKKELSTNLGRKGYILGHKGLL